VDEGQVPSGEDRGEGRPEKVGTRKPRKAKASEWQWVKGGNAAPRKPGARPRGKARRYVLIASGLWMLLLAFVFSSYLLADLPDTANLLVYEPREDISLYDADNRLIARRGLTHGAVIAVGDLPEHVGNAFIAVEDRRFRYHFGIDPIGLGRALAVDIYHGAFVQGGSTITQQLAKNLFLEPKRTLTRKFEEALLALKLERRYTKDQILTLYVNRVYFGAGVYGIEAAAQRFFAKSARDLTLIEAAILAGSVKAPSRYNAATDMDAALARARIVLDAMERSGFIEDSEAQMAAAMRPKISPGLATPGAGYFVDYTIQLVPGFAGRDATINERLIVETTLDLDMQAAAEHALNAGLEADGAALNAGQGALVAMTPDGAVRALVGGRSYDDSPFNRAIDAYRQPGSSFKPFVYVGALEKGWRPEDRVFDGPISVGNWTPQNYEGEYKGDITLSYALAHSSNSAAVQLTNAIGPEQVARIAHRMGITASLLEVPSLALGTSEVTPMEMVTAYAAIANGGTGVIPHVITRISTESGRILYQRSGTGAGQVMSAEVNAEMNEMMMRTVTEGTGRAASLGDRQVAGKTGTSQDYRDAWFVGFTADFVTGVWIGNDDNVPMVRATGGGLPARIFQAFMMEASEGLPETRLPGSEYRLQMAQAATSIPDSFFEQEAPPPREDEEDGIIGAFEALLNRLF
jgi:penicillin-binding protein 1A